MSEVKSNNNFKYDLKIGQLAEDELGSIFSHSKIEVKRDLVALKTGNFFLEFEAYGKPSGIAISEADWYALVFGQDLSIYHLIEKNKLKEIGRKWYGKKGFVRGGDNKTAKGVLIPISEFVKY